MILTLTEVAIGLLWAGMGVLAAYLLMHSIQNSTRKFEPGMSSGLALIVIGGMFFRLAVMAGLLYLSVKMGIIYSLVFVSMFSVIRFILISRLSKKAKIEKQQVQDQ